MKYKRFISFMIIIGSFFLFFVVGHASTKEDIFKLVNSQKQCGSEVSSLFDSYNMTYTRLINEKDLSPSEINQILGYLNTAYKIINDKNICTLSDLNKLTDKEKNTIYNSLVAGSRIINNAPSMINRVDDKPAPKKGNSGVIVDRSNKTIDIYDDGVLIDKLPFGNHKLTYTGPNKYIALVLFGLIFFYVFMPLGYNFLLKNKDSYLMMIIKKIYIDVSYSLIFSVLIIGIPYFSFKHEIEVASNVAKLFRNIVSSEITGNKKEIIVEDQKIKVYPAYGDKYASLMIPNIGATAEVTFGDSALLLKNNIGHYTSSFLPGEGGSIIYSGHNSRGMLANLGNLKIGSNIVITTSYGEFIYKVSEFKIINDTEWVNLPIVDNNERLMIYTCYPFSSIIYGSKRYVVYADLYTSNWTVGDQDE
jgi:sortase A